MNSKIKSGELSASNDLSIANLYVSSEDNELFAGRPTPVKYHWWGYSRYANDLESRILASNLATVGHVYTGVAVVSTFFGNVPTAFVGGIGTVYFYLVSSRIDANNYRRGVHVSMT